MVDDLDNFSQLGIAGNNWDPLRTFPIVVNESILLVVLHQLLEQTDTPLKR